MGLIRRCPTCKKLGLPYSAQGHECKHKDAKWAAKFLVGGKQVLKTLGSNKREAERYLMQIKSELASGGSFQDIRPILFKELAEGWLKNYEQSANPKPGTISAYETRLRLHILPLMGHMVVNQIAARDIELVKQKLREKLGAHSTNQTLVEIGTILKHGWTLEYCKSNPAQLVKKYTIEKGPGRTLSKEEAMLLLRQLNEPFRTIIFSVLCTGTRVGEITALQWKDIDYKNNLISIRRNVVRGVIGKNGMKDKTWIFGTPKSKDSGRRVILIPALKRAMLRHNEQGGSNPLGLVFCTKAGNPYDRSMIRAKLDAAVKAARLEHVRIHDLRHTNASLFLAGGASLAYVSKHLGHSSAAFTADIYHHLLPKEHERGMKILDGIFPVCDTGATSHKKMPDRG